LGEDWNLVLNNELDKDGRSTHANKLAKNSLQSFINLLNLSDIYRECNPLKKVYTRFQNQPYTATRLDFFLISKSLR